MKTIGFAGTAKNTGKTTSALAVIKQAHAAGVSVAVTSIGYDGEDKDNVTGLPKPRYLLTAGDLVATAKDCLTVGTAILETIEDTEISTILGNVILARVVKEGTVLVAGANREKDLEILISKFDALKVDLLIVDGALNRMVPMIACDGLVLSTGAAFETNIHVLADHTLQLINLFKPSIFTGEIPHTIQITSGNKKQTCITSSSLLSQKTVDEIIQCSINSLESLVIPGACHPALLISLTKLFNSTQKEIQLVLGSPLKLIASGTLEQWKEVFENPIYKISYLRSLPVRMLTVNPFYPKLRPQTGSYITVYVDKQFLLRTMRTVLPDFPIYDLILSPQPDLLRLLGIIVESKPDA